MPILSDVDDQFRFAAHWTRILRRRGGKSRTLRDFAAWLAQRADHRRVFARCEVLWRTVEIAVSKRVSTPASEVDRPTGEKGA